MGMEVGPEKKVVLIMADKFRYLLLVPGKSFTVGIEKWSSAEEAVHTGGMTRWVVRFCGPSIQGRLDPTTILIPSWMIHEHGSWINHVPKVCGVGTVELT